MARAIALVLAVGIAAAALFIAWHGNGRSDDAAFERPLPSPAVLPAAAPARGEPVLGPPAEPAAGFSDAEVRALLERLVTLDGVGALEDDALVRLVEQELERAIRHTATIADRGERMWRVRALADFAVGLDPFIALQAADSIDSVRGSYTRDVFASWTAIDSGAVFAYAAANPDIAASGALEWSLLARADPEATLALTERHSRGAADSLRFGQVVAVGVWARTDPLAAIAYAEAEPDIGQRGVLLNAAGRSYARSFPHAAWEWAIGLSSSDGTIGPAPPAESTAHAVLAEIASFDFDLATSLLLDESSDIGLSPLAVTEILEVEPSIAERLAERLAVVSSPRANTLLSFVLSKWASDDYTAAFEWLLTSSARLPDPGTLFESFEANVRDQPERVVDAFHRLPTNLRAEWLRATGAAIGTAAPGDAMGLVATLAHRPGYEAAFAAVVAGIAEQDPPAAARLIEAQPASVQAAAVARVAAIWARQDAAAAAWTERIPDTAVRAAAVREVTLNWPRRDVAGARRWALTLPRGAVRDAGMQGLLVTDLRDGELDETLLAEFSSDSARQTAVSAAIATPDVNLQHREIAVDLMTRFLRDEELLERAAAGIAQGDAIRSRLTPRPPPRALLIAAAEQASAQASAQRLAQRITPAFQRALARYTEAEPTRLPISAAVLARREAHATVASRGFDYDAIIDVPVTLQLREIGATRFVLEALERQAAADPAAAFDNAMRLKAGPLRVAALRKIAVRWVDTDPYAARTAVNRLPYDLQSVYLGDVLTAWARSDAESFVRQLETEEMNAFTRRAVTEFTDLIRAYPESARVIGARLPVRQRDMLGVP